jgi:hypothetical protein
MPDELDDELAPDELAPAPVLLEAPESQATTAPIARPNTKLLPNIGGTIFIIIP